MDAQEWELLSKEEGLFEIRDSNEEIKNHTTNTTTTSVPSSLMSYFTRPQSFRTKVHPVPLETSGPKLQQHEEASADPPTPSQGTESGALRASPDEDAFSNFVDEKAESKAAGDMEMATERSNGRGSSGADKFDIWKWSLIVGVTAAVGFSVIGSWTHTNSKRKNQKHHHHHHHHHHQRD